MHEAHMNPLYQHLIRRWEFGGKCHQVKCLYRAYLALNRTKAENCSKSNP